MKQITEDVIQNQCVNHIITHYTSKQVICYSVPNELGSNLVSGILAENNGKGKTMLYKVLSRVLGKFKLMGMRRGVADLHLCFPNGKLVYVEFKTTTGTQKEEQKMFQKQVEALGFKYYVCRSLEEFKEIVYDNCR